MRADQYEKLLDLQEQLTDVFLTEADPSNFPGAGKPAATWTKDERGDRYWCKKNASASLSIVLRLTNLVESERRRAQGVPAGEGDVPDDDADDLMDRDIKAAQREAEKLLARVHGRQE